MRHRAEAAKWKNEKEYLDGYCMRLKLLVQVELLEGLLYYHFTHVTIYFVGQIRPDRVPDLFCHDPPRQEEAQNDCDLSNDLTTSTSRQ